MKLKITIDCESADEAANITAAIRDMETPDTQKDQMAMPFDETALLRNEALALGLEIPAAAGASWIKNAILKAKAEAKAPEAAEAPKPAPVKEPKKVVKAKSEPAKEEPVKTEPAIPAASVDDVKRSLALLMSRKSPEAGLEVLKGFNAKRVSELAPENYAEVVKAADAALKV